MKKFEKKQIVDEISVYQFSLYFDQNVDLNDLLLEEQKKYVAPVTKGESKKLINWDLKNSCIFFSIFF